jgi:hypothetical protein
MGFGGSPWFESRLGRAALSVSIFSLHSSDTFNLNPEERLACLLSISPHLSRPFSISSHPQLYLVTTMAGWYYTGFNVKKKSDLMATGIASAIYRDEGGLLAELPGSNPG